MSATGSGRRQRRADGGAAGGKAGSAESTARVVRSGAYSAGILLVALLGRGKRPHQHCCHLQQAH
jgi:hypothetical protein